MTRWYHIWPTVLIRPTEATFTKLSREMLSEPKAKRQAFNWVFLTSFGILFSLFTYSRINHLRIQEQSIGDFLSILTNLFMTAFIPTILYTVAILVSFIALTSSVYIISHILKDRRTLVHLIYIFSTFFAPIGVISFVISLFPPVKYLNIFLIPYLLFLYLMATKSLNQFSWVKATISNIFVFIFLGIYLIGVF